jgi:hypothetical protein
MGAENSKAWVRGVTSLTVVSAATLDVTGALAQPAAYDPDEWQFEMDSTTLDVGDGGKKYQGAPLGDVLSAMAPAPDADTVVLHADSEATTLPLDEVLADDGVRIFTVVSEADVTFAVARMSGEVIAPQVTAIEVK